MHFTRISAKIEFQMTCIGEIRKSLKPKRSFHLDFTPKTVNYLKRLTGNGSMAPSIMTSGRPTPFHLFHSDRHPKGRAVQAN
jgi:hypothetical protein